MANEYILDQLDNGLRIVIEPMPDVPSAAAGFLVRTGARDETADIAGMAHFLEHMMFKGTRKRNWQEITADFDRMGSTYNAYTSETRTVYYGWVRRADITRQIELLADMLRSALPPEEFDVEKNVILEEIAMSKDQLEHVAIDFIQEKVFTGHPLSWPILGYEHTVGSMDRDRMWEYFQQRYAPDHIYLVVAGNVSAAEVIRAAKQYCGDWQPSGEVPARQVPVVLGGRDLLVTEQFHQQIVALTYPAVPAARPLTETAAAAASILGGENSRYYWNIIQKGICARAGAFHLDYEDVGVMILWAACAPEQCERLYEALCAEADRICREPVAGAEVQRVKNRRRTSLAAEAEAPYHRLSQLMEDLEFYGAPRSVEELLAEVDAVSVERIEEYFRAYPINAGGHLASVGPRHWPNGKP